MAGYTYPIPQLEGTLSAEEVHRLLQSPVKVAQIVRSLANQRFIADWLLGGRYEAKGGAVLYDDQGEEIFAADTPEAIAPGGEYPLTVMTTGELKAAKTTKWGLDTEIYDEAIARLGIDPVNRALNRTVNSVVKLVDEITLGVIGSKVTASVASSATWTTGEAIVESVLTAKAVGDNQGEGGYNMNTALVSPVQFAKVGAYLISGGFLPREQGNVVLTGQLPIDALGVTWATSPHKPFADPMLVDRDQLGGMADEDLKSPGYSRVDPLGRRTTVGVETKVNRLNGEDDRDGYRPRARRVTVPVVTDKNAGIRITGTQI